MCLSYIPVTLWALSYQFHGWSVYSTRSKGMSQISVESRRRDMMVIGCESSQDSKSFPMRDPRIKGKWLNFYKAVDLFNLYNDLFCFFLKVDVLLTNGLGFCLKMSYEVMLRLWLWELLLQGLNQSKEEVFFFFLSWSMT